MQPAPTKYEVYGPSPNPYGDPKHVDYENNHHVWFGRTTRHYERVMNDNLVRIAKSCGWDVVPGNDALGRINPEGFLLYVYADDVRRQWSWEIRFHGKVHSSFKWKTQTPIGTLRLGRKSDEIRLRKSERTCIRQTY